MDMLQRCSVFVSAEVYGNHYGTSQLWVNEQLDAGLDVILEIDWQWAVQVRNLDSNACSIFILPPSLETLKTRLLDRAQDDTETIEKRMKQAVAAISHVAEADFVVINDENPNQIGAVRNFQGYQSTLF